MRLCRFVLTLVSLVAVLPGAWATASLDPEEVARLPTIVVDGVTCTLSDAIQAANTAATLGGCTGSPGIEVISLETDITLTAASPFAATVGGAEAGLPDINSAIVIEGNGRTIERDASLTCEPNDPASFRLFNVSGTGALYLIDLTLRGGCVAPADGIQAHGGAIHLEGGALELNRVVLENHRALGTASGSEGAVGGALFCSNALITALYDSTFTGNIALGSDGQVASTVATGGAGYFDQCQVGSIESSSFIGNMAMGSTDRDASGRAGGLYFADSSVESLSHVSFVDNVAQAGDDNLGGSSSSADGGGLYLRNSTFQSFLSATFLRNQVLAGNSLMSSGNTASGGAIYLSGGSLPMIRQSHFEDNFAKSGDAAVDSSPGDCRGGAIRVRSSAVVAGIEDSLFLGNECRSGQNGGVGGGTTASGGAIDVTGAEITSIERVTFADNVAIAVAASSSISGNGGAINTEGTISRIVSSTFDGNRAVGGTDKDPGDVGGRGRGGALRLGSPISMIQGNTFVNNQARGGDGDGGSGPAQGGAIWSGEITPISLGGNLFSGNLAVLADGTATPEDCLDEGPGIVSEGWNLVESPGTCTFAATGDLTGVTTATYSLADWGCQSPLPDGSCVPTVAIDETSPAVDQSSCVDLMLLTDGRDLTRPFDLPAVADADDGCDIGAFEARDTDGDGFTEATDCAPDDPGVHAVDVCGECDGDGSSCVIFQDGFESGDTLAWS